MVQIALKLSKKAIAAVKLLATSIKTRLTGNASFPTPSPTPAEIGTAITAVTDQEGVLKDAEDNVTDQRNLLGQKVDALCNLLRASAVNCQNTVKNDDEATQRAKLLSANFPLRADNAPADAVDVPTNFHVTQGDHTGSADGGCNKVQGAKMYRARAGAAADGPFTTVYEGTKSSWTATGLAMGDTWFQMLAFGTNGGWSDWSDPARCHVI